MKSLFVKIFILTVCLGQALFGLDLTEEQIGYQEELLGYQWNFSLPVNWTGGSRDNLHVTIPRGYRPLQSEWRTILEFVPENEDGDNWSEIITVTKYIGKRLSATDVTSLIAEGIINQAKDSQILLNSNEDTGRIKKSRLGIMYTYQGRKELILMNYFSGPLDCVGVQYTVRIPENQNIVDVSKKMVDFVETLKLYRMSNP